MLVDPIPGEPAAIATLDGERALVIGDYHAGIESALRYEGLEIESRAADRLQHLVSLLDQSHPDRVIFLGDLAHWIGEPYGTELDEIETVVSTVTERVPAVLVKGNHDGKIEDAVDLPVTDANGVVFGNIGFVHGHTVPSEAVVTSDVVCVGHEHISVRITDAVGGRRVERAWLRGRLDPAGFEDVPPEDITGELVFFPAFNDLVGGTWVNVPGQDFLAPFMPDGLRDGEVYLLDGTRLGPYRNV